MSYTLIDKYNLQNDYEVVKRENNRIVYLQKIYHELEEIDYDQFTTEDDTPVENIFSEIAQRLLIDVLFNNKWTNRDFWASSNVGIYYALGKSAIVPDMFLSLDIKKPSKWFDKKNKCYFTWLAGKAPDLVVEIISNKVGNEDLKKKQIYAQMGVTYYVLVDPHFNIYKERLNVFTLREGKYEKLETEYFYMEEVQLGIMIWEGLFEKEKAPWARWCTKEGNLLLTGAERVEKEAERAEQEKQRAEQEKQRAEQEKQRAEQEKQRADKLLAYLKSLGLSPEDTEE